tara:strand:+ start:107 stop:271 length:165 start_codon:yes stop_codon:yes gene_type:complete
MAKSINKLQKINKLEKDNYRLRNLVMGYKKAIKQVREQRNTLIMKLADVTSGDK